MTPNEILDHLEAMFPHAECELVHRNVYELISAVVLSAQATDVSVNKITPKLFEKFPTIEAMAQAEIKDIEECIKNIGLYRNKARMLKEMAVKVVNEHQGQIPDTRKELVLLPGVGRKTANVVLSVWYDVPAIAVDTHVDRVSKRLRLAKPTDSVEKVEEKLRRKLPRSRWNRAHHLMIFFGRYHCKARNPMCDQCPFQNFCRYYKESNQISV